MPSFRDTFSTVWDSLNPKEPTAGFLAKFFAAAIVVFGVAILIGYG